MASPCLLHSSGGRSGSCEPAKGPDSSPRKSLAGRALVRTLKNNEHLQGTCACELEFRTLCKNTCIYTPPTHTPTKAEKWKMHPSATCSNFLSSYISNNLRIKLKETSSILLFQIKKSRASNLKKHESRKSGHSSIFLGSK